MAIKNFPVTITAATVYAIPGKYSFPGEPRVEREALRLTIETANGQSVHGVVFDSTEVPETEAELVEMIPTMDSDFDVLASVRPRDCILKPTWRRQDVEAGLVNVEDAVCAYIDYYAQTGEILNDPDELKDAIRNLAWNKADITGILNYTGKVSELNYAIYLALREGHLV